MLELLGRNTTTSIQSFAGVVADGDSRAAAMPVRRAMSIMREATLVYAPVEGAPCILGHLRVNPDETLEWNPKDDVSFASEDDAAVIAGLREYLEDGSLDIGGAALFEWITSTFSHTIQVQESAFRPLKQAAGRALQC